MAGRLPALWFARRLMPALLPLLPLSWLFSALAALRRALYRRGVLRRAAAGVPVVVVGNITVGGSGKTPAVLALCAELLARGRRPGIVSRGYGAAASPPRRVRPDDDPARVGDEPLLLARRAGCPVVVGRDRAAAAALLRAEYPACDVIIADDGLQHYRLARDVEIAVFDARGAGNGRLLPAGPLREPLARLQAVDAVLWNGAVEARTARAAGGTPQFTMTLAGTRFVALRDPARSCLPADLAGRPLHAIAGIGDPERFFAQLRSLDLDFVPHPFPDHHPYVAADLAFAAGGVLLMTEKDAVKCAALELGEAWVLPVTAGIPPGLTQLILEKLDGCTPSGHSRLPGLQG